jgi:hypothetical protein
MIEPNPDAQSPLGVVRRGRLVHDRPDSSSCSFGADAAVLCRLAVAITSGDRAGRFFDDFVSSVPVDRPVEESMAAILSVTSRPGVALTDW